MGYRDEREALIAERDSLRRDLEKNAAELEALRTVAEENAALEREIARLREASPGAPEQGEQGPQDADVEAPDGFRRPSASQAFSVVAAAVILAVLYARHPRASGGLRSGGSDAGDATRTEEDGARPDAARARIPLRSCVPEGSQETFHVRTVISGAGVVTSASVMSTNLGALVEDTPASTCVEAAMLGRYVPVLRDVTVMLPIEPGIADEDLMWASALAHVGRP